MARIIEPCAVCGGDVGTQGCAHGVRLDPSQIAWRTACATHDRILRPGRPPKKGPPCGWFSIEEIVEQTEGLTQSLFQEALTVRREIVTDQSDARWGQLDRGEISVGAVYDARREAKGTNSVHNLAGGGIRALDDAARAQRDRRFTQADLRDPYLKMVGNDFVDVATERDAQGENPMRAPHVITVEEDGIVADWGPLDRPAWCNKPFRLRAPFLGRCLQEASRGRHVTYLETHDISTVVAQTALRYAHEIIACEGRPKFDKPDGEPEHGPTFGTILYGFGGEISPMISHGLAGIALIPTARVEEMLQAAIRATRDGRSEEEALHAARAVPGLRVSEDVIAALLGGNDQRPASDDAMSEAA